MKNIFTAMTVLALITGISVKAEDLKKLSLDDASAIAPKIQTDETIKTEGKASVKITTLSPTSVCIGEVSEINVDDAKLIFQAKVRTDIKGSAYLEMWVKVGGRYYFSKGLNDMLKGKSEWKTIQTVFMLQKGQKAESAVLNIVINGKGTVWIDDAVLTKGMLTNLIQAPTKSITIPGVIAKGAILSKRQGNSFYYRKKCGSCGFVSPKQQGSKLLPVFKMSIEFTCPKCGKATKGSIERGQR